jgi:hypothetical protein
MSGNMHRVYCVAAGAALVGLMACGPGGPPIGVELAVRRPPPARVEVVGTAPGAGYAYIRGHYAWQGGDYVWISGRWEAPPSRGRRWRAGQWRHARGGWYWVDGHWQ